MTTEQQNIKFLTLQFEGYFACRIATDPDPTNEERGMSGYTMALSTETKLDQVIRLQVDEDYIRQNLRPPGREIGMDNNLLKGVQVRKILCGGEEYQSNLLGASLILDGKDGIMDGPTFESRNNITGSDDVFGFVITPFELRIEKGKEGSQDFLKIIAKDYVNPTDKSAKIWQITNPSIYGRRLPTGYDLNSEEVNKAINVFDYYGYFRDRRRYMEGEIERYEKLIKKLDHRKWNKEEREKRLLDYQTKIEQFKSRIYQIEFWGDRVSSKIGTKVNWDFNINGDPDVKKVAAGEITIWKQGETRKVAVANSDWDWPISFWFGGWDGDLLTGYMRGALKIPVTLEG